MAIVSNTVGYLDGDVLLEAFFAYDDSFSGRRPAVLINHTWAGRDNFVAEKAKKIAALGYVGFAVDMYGKGVLGSSAEENAKLMQPFMESRGMLQKRMLAALYAVKLMPWVDDSKVAAMGFCFGGLCSLDLARTGVDLKGVVSFHGLLGAPGNTQGNAIKAKILALHVPARRAGVPNPPPGETTVTTAPAGRSTWTLAGSAREERAPAPTRTRFSPAPRARHPPGRRARARDAR